MEQDKTTSQICNLGEILSNNKFNKIFIIPPYQRLYAWDKEQIKILLDDFKNCMNDNNKSHFIGNVVVANNEDNFELVDGQQRLSTIFFLCVYMCFKNNKMQEAKGDFEKAYKFAFVKKDKEEKCRIHMPIREDDENAIWDYDFDKTNANIKLAFDCFAEYFKKADDCCDESLKKAELKSFCDFIFTNVKFNLVILGDQVELNKYFVRMNNTGVQLDGTDILKARLLKLISDYEENQNNTNKTSDCENKKSKDKTSKESKATKYARIFDECSQMNYFSDFSFIDNNTNTNTTKPTIENIIKNKQDLQNYSNNDKDRAEFESIIDFPTFVLHVFKILSRQESTKNYFKSQISIKKDKFLENTWDCLEFNNNCGAKIAIKTIRALKKYRIIFDTFMIKRKSDDDENIYKLWNKNNNWSEVSEANDLAIIQNYLRVARRGDNTNYHHFLTHYLEFCKNEIMSKEEISRDNCLAKLKIRGNADKLRNYLKSIDDFLAIKQFKNENNPEKNTKNLIDIISDKSFNEISSEEQTDITNLNFNNTDKPNFNFLNYGTNTPHYWFYRLEYYLLINEDKNSDKYSNYKENYRFRYLNSIEHIHAQNIANGNRFSDDVLHSFGNLALISSSENSSLSNKPFLVKKDWFKNNNIMNLKLFKVFENENWNEEKAKDHQEKMLEILKNSFKN